MPITETVVSLARSVVKARSPLSDYEQSLCDALLNMPEFLRHRRLDFWEQQFREAWERGESVETISNYPIATSQLLIEIFKLGSFNLYTAFDRAGVRRELNALIRRFKKHANIDILDNLDVTDW